MKKKPENKCLTPKQHQAVLELLKPLRRSYQEVAKELGITSRSLFNWRRAPEFQKALEKAQSELKERVYSSSEFALQIHALDSKLDFEIKILTAVEITEAIIKIAESQVRLSERLTALTEQIEQLKRSM